MSSQYRPHFAGPTPTSPRVLVAPAGQKALWADGTVVPTDGTPGYEHGCIFTHTDGTTGADAMYLNIGTADSCNFDPFGQVGAFTALTVDTIDEATTDLGVTVEGVLFVDSGEQFSDDNSLIFGTGGDVALKWSTADASNHALALGLGASQQLHITDVGAIATDWNVSASSNPELYIHSDTTPATDYIRIGGHTGTVADIDLVGGTALQLKIGGTEYASLRVTGLAVGTYVQAATAGTDQLTLKSTGTAPASTGANVGHLFADFEADDDELFWLSGTNGTSTQLTT